MNYSQVLNWEVNWVELHFQSSPLNNTAWMSATINKWGFTSIFSIGLQVRRGKLLVPPQACWTKQVLKMLNSSLIYFPIENLFIGFRTAAWPAQHSGGRVSALRLVGCRFNLWPAQIKHCTNGTHCLPAWHSGWWVKHWGQIGGTLTDMSWFHQPGVNHTPMEPWFDDSPWRRFTSEVGILTGSCWFWMSWSATLLQQFNAN